MIETAISLRQPVLHFLEVLLFKLQIEKTERSKN